MKGYNVPFITIIASGAERAVSAYLEWMRIFGQYRVARAPISRSMRMFRDMGMTETAHGVEDANNPSGALQLHTDLGYRVNKEFITFRREMKAA